MINIRIIGQESQLPKRKKQSSPYLGVVLALVYARIVRVPGIVAKTLMCVQMASCVRLAGIAIIFLLTTWQLVGITLSGPAGMYM